MSANKYLFAVGGTGQCILLNYLRLSFVAGFRPVRYYIVDADSTGPLAARIAEFSAITHQNPGDALILPFPHFRREQSTNARVLAPESADGMDDVLGAFYSREELDNDPGKGFFGLPAIAASIANRKIHIVETKDDFGGDRRFKEVIDALRRDEMKGVVFVGSNYGGTGAGVMPPFARYFKRLAPGHNHVSVLCMLPWFQLLRPSDGGSRKEPVIDPERLRNNAEGGVAYYGERLRKGIDEVIFLGLSSLEDRNYTHASGDQPEHMHPINLLAAIMAHENLAQDQKIRTEDEEGEGGVASFWKLDTGLDLEAITIPRSSEDGGAISLFDALRVFQARENMLRLFVEFLDPPPAVSLDFFPNRVFPTPFENALRLVGGKKANRERTLTELRKEMEGRLKRYADTMEWLLGTPEAAKDLRKAGIQRPGFLTFNRDALKFTGRFDRYKKHPTTFFFKALSALVPGDRTNPEIKTMEQLANAIEDEIRLLLERELLDKAR